MDQGVAGRVLREHASPGLHWLGVARCMSACSPLGDSQKPASPPAALQNRTCRLHLMNGGASSLRLT